MVDFINSCIINKLCTNSRHNINFLYNLMAQFFTHRIKQIYTMIEVIFKIFLTDYIDFQGFITKRIQKPLLIEYKR
jgi:hypothetical protein